MKKIGVIFWIGVLLLLFPQRASANPVNPVIWKTAYNEFSSSDFYIQIADERFLGSDNARVSSDPGMERTTLELEWVENGVQMRLYFYFKKVENGMWRMYDLRTYNAEGTDWIGYPSYDELGNPVESLVGQRNYAYERTFLSKDGKARIYCKECSITAFISNVPPPSVYGYILDFRIGIPQNETITITNDPNTGYGVNAVLLDSSGEVVKDQSDFSYHWSAENESILAIMAQSVPYPDGNCAYGVLAPCPNFNVQIRGVNPGISRVLLDVMRKSDRTVVVSNAFSVRVIEKSQSPPPTVAPTPASSGSPLEDVTAQLEELQGEVGRLSETVQQQQAQISIIQRIIQSIQSFLQRIFRYRFW